MRKKALLLAASASVASGMGGGKEHLGALGVLYACPRSPVAHPAVFLCE